MSPRPRDWYYRFKCGHRKTPDNRVGKAKTCRICTYRHLHRFTAKRMPKAKPPHLRRRNKNDLSFDQAEEIRALTRRGHSQKAIAKQFRIGQEAVRDIVTLKFLPVRPLPPEPVKPLLEIIRAEIAVKPVPAPAADGRSYGMFPPRKRSA